MQSKVWNPRSHNLFSITAAISLKNGDVMLGITTPIELVFRNRKLRAPRLTR